MIALRALDRGGRLVATGLRLFERLLAGISLHRKRLLAVEFELRLLGFGLRRKHLRLGLIDIGRLRDDLAADPVDGRLLGRDLFARRVRRELVVAVVDRGDHVAGMDRGIVVDRNAGDVTGNLRRRASCCGRRT